ncbi:BaiN/RdsA family NAD(P)/FAD-dependent oxidoreductase [Micavibrio aeruginosavorus]|uniref:NAD(FAD)-utilizing dehydrogenase n=1 Tax=Micavibrio aeruginosavorus EPB TaxID=349215 RepID=M4VFU3_9BACT|nr:TIGR03862 family flavoprotein [Micavibrio aeruginosavorus]AGH96921.1 NAD(FAD)-utilizing dehydrogenase [Micavibrio aeruginosavorus EPB]
MTQAKKHIVIIGGGPAGLFAAEYLAGAGHAVHVYEHKPTLARKFLMAGRGGLNLTHSEDLESFIARYGAASDWVGPMVRDFTPSDLRDWCKGLGEETFVGSSGRVFPRSFKASPLLRAWQARLDGLGVTFHFNHHWAGWNDAGALMFTDKNGMAVVARAEATLLALGGASWPKLGSDAGWVDLLRGRGVAMAPFRPANSGFTHPWSDHFADRFAGQPLKSITLTHSGRSVPGEMMIAAKSHERGVEGGVIYALSASIRTAVEHDGETIVHIDLRPGVTLEDLARRLSGPRGRASFSTHMKKAGGLSPLAAALLRELGGEEVSTLSPIMLATLIKALPLPLSAPFGLARAISSAGGIAREAVKGDLMLQSLPGVFVAGEMLDWEAPTGGYLLQATFATALHAARGIERFLKASD